MISIARLYAIGREGLVRVIVRANRGCTISQCFGYGDGFSEARKIFEPCVPSSVYSFFADWNKVGGEFFCWSIIRNMKMKCVASAVMLLTLGLGFIGCAPAGPAKNATPTATEKAAPDGHAADGAKKEEPAH